MPKKEQRLIVLRREKDPRTTLERIRVSQNSFSSSETVSECTIRSILNYSFFVEEPKNSQVEQ